MTDVVKISYKYAVTGVICISVESKDESRALSKPPIHRSLKMWSWGVFSVLSVVYFSGEAEGHGFMLFPPNRASLWRIDPSQPMNVNDMEYFCGGSHVQYDLNGGKCGPCGDSWSDPIPRSNENGGIYGNGVIKANYTAGSVIKVTSLITGNHLGSVFFHICELKDSNKPETEECFKPLRLADGTDSLPIRHLDQRLETEVKLPDELVCERCVLRWHYRAANSWGRCDDGTESIGCGDQEVFRSCADIRITSPEPEPQPDESSDEKDDSYEVQPCIINPEYLKVHHHHNKKFRPEF